MHNFYQKLSATELFNAYASKIEKHYIKRDITVLLLRERQNPYRCRYLDETVYNVYLIRNSNKQVYFNLYLVCVCAIYMRMCCVYLVIFNLYYYGLCRINRESNILHKSMSVEKKTDKNIASFFYLY